MSTTIEAVQRRIMDLFDREVDALSQEDYRDLCENLASDFESRYEAAREEIGDSE